MARSQDDGKLEREIERLRADAARLQFIFSDDCPRHLHVATGQDFRVAIDAVMKGHCPELKKKQGFGEGSDAFWDFIEKKREGGE